MNCSLSNVATLSNVKDDNKSDADLQINETVSTTSQSTGMIREHSPMYLMQEEQLQHPHQSMPQKLNSIESTSVSLNSQTLYSEYSVSPALSCSGISTTSSNSSNESLIAQHSLLLLSSSIELPGSQFRQGNTDNALQKQYVSYSQKIQCMSSDDSFCADMKSDSNSPNTPQNIAGSQHFLTESGQGAEFNMPKKPLTPYMKYSKSIWHQVKCANPSMSVCEAGASIGRLWREMSAINKQKFNETFSQEKAQYEAALQSYLKLTGFRMSDMTKPKLHKKDAKNKSHTEMVHTLTFENADASNIPLSNTNLICTESSHTKQRCTVKDAESHHSTASSFGMSSTPTSGAVILPNISQMWNAHSSAQINIRRSFLNENENMDTSATEIVMEADLSSDQPVNTKKNNDVIPASISLVTSPPQFDNDVPKILSAYLHRNTKISSDINTGRNITEITTVDDELESGEIVVDRPRLAAHLIKLMNAYSTRSDSVVPQTASAHKVYNSYSFNPWIQYKSDDNNWASFICSRDHLLKTELEHLRLSLSDKMIEVERLCSELQQANEVIDNLKQRIN